ncbi:hypothetical protein GYMLUDRAFT_50033 [Collybiopsis luxurians FD-317 M1]|uniref:Uncharacterized protein n=1 Tax=Collybiopsis luxurians FD-317 M1 TaxID=944289 RepID=A0A0D0BRJ5_9AGAR|nr:hypothetical protein GYMLUDRAFT_50033 [Collybiopsis luxurians FD-317 M1]
MAFFQCSTNIPCADASQGFEPRLSFDHTSSSHLQNNFYGSSSVAINSNPTFAEFRAPSLPPS